MAPVAVSILHVALENVVVIANNTMVGGYRKFIHDELELRQLRNSNYSQNAFARDLGIAPSKLAQILNGTTGLSPERGEVIAEKLRLSEIEQELFLSMIEADHARSPQVKKRAKERIRLFFKDSVNYSRLHRAEVFKRWWHLAILNMLDKRVGLSAEDIATRLNLDIDLTYNSLSILVAAELAVQKDTHFLSLESDFETTYEVSSELNRLHHQQYLTKASESLSSTPATFREFLSLLVMFDVDRLPTIKSEMRKFIKSINENYSGGDHKKMQLYSFMMQLFPVANNDRGSNGKN